MADKVLTMAGADPSCVCPQPSQKLTLVVTKTKRYPDGRHCKRVGVKGSGSCRCLEWGKGKGTKRVSTMCAEAGHAFKIGSKQLSPKKE